MSADDKVAKGREAWGRLKTSRLWDDYLAVGDALDEGRSWAMRGAHVNRPVGRAFNNMMGQWLREHGFSEIDKTVRSQILRCMDNKAEIEAWRAGLKPSERLEFNHPAAVLRQWRQASKAKPQADKSSPMAELKAKVVRLEAEIKRLKDSRGNSFTPNDKPEDIAAAVASEMVGATSHKYEETATAVADRLRTEAHKQRVREDEQKAGPKKAGVTMPPVKSLSLLPDDGEDE
jgi:hypothetical protein